MANVPNKKLKQGQLSFTVMVPLIQTNAHKIGNKTEAKRNKSPVRAISEGKENDAVSSNTSELNKQVLDNQSSVVNIIDLTDDSSRTCMDQDDQDIPCCSDVNNTAEARSQSIDSTIDNVVVWASKEIDEQDKKAESGAKKKRRRSKSLSPNPHAKRQILAGEKPKHESKVHRNSSVGVVVPTIVISAPSPSEHNKKKRRSILDVLNAKRVALVSEKDDTKVPSAIKTNVCETSEKTTKPLVGQATSSSKKRVRSPSPKGPKKNVGEKNDDPAVRSTTPLKKIKQQQMENDPPVVDTHENEEDLNDKMTGVDVVSNDGSFNQSEEGILQIIEPDVIEVLSSPKRSMQSTDSKLRTPSPSGKENNAEKRSPKSDKKPRTVNLETIRKKEEKEKEKEEKRKQREDLRLEKEKEKMELKKKKDEEKAQKEEEKKKKREEEERLKAERLKKQEEKQREKEQREQEKKREKERKDEEKRQKELEKQKLEEKKMQAEEEKRKKSEKRAETFKSFFKSPTTKSPTVKKLLKQIGVFVPFQPKENMTLAPRNRRPALTAMQKEDLEKELNDQMTATDFLEQVSFRSARLKMNIIEEQEKRNMSLSEDGLEIVNSEDNKSMFETMPVKFLSFHDNIRPPYYGTWRKESQQITGTSQLVKDMDFLDYDFDSEDEWEDPVDAEDIDKSDGEDEGDTNEEDEDDGFFVPHGYLSDDEGIDQDDEEEQHSLSDHKLKEKQQEFEASFKRKLSTLTPVVIGCVWPDSADSLHVAHRRMLASYRMQVLGNKPIEIHPGNNLTDNKDSSDRPETGSRSLMPVPDEAIPDLIRLLHGNPNSIHRIVIEFREYWRLKLAAGEEPIAYGPVSLDKINQQTEDDNMDTDEPNNSEVAAECSSGRNSPIEDADGPSIKNMDLAAHSISKTQLIKRCKEIATYSRKENMNRSCWFVHDSILEEHALGKDVAPVPCQWKYVTEVPKIQVLIFPQSTPKVTANQDLVKTMPQTVSSPASNIVKYAAKVSATDLLEKSKKKYDREKQSQPQSSALTIAKFTTEVLPADLLAKSKQKLEEEAAKVKRNDESSSNNSAKQKQTPQTLEGVYVLPKPEAVRSFFGLDAFTSENSSKSGVQESSKDDIETEVDDHQSTPEESQVRSQIRK